MGGSSRSEEKLCRDMGLDFLVQEQFIYSPVFIVSRVGKKAGLHDVGTTG